MENEIELLKDRLTQRLDNDSFKLAVYGTDDFVNKIKGRNFRTALDVLDVIRLCFGDYKWHNNSDGTLTVKVNEGTYKIKFAYEPLVDGTSERVTVSNITMIAE